MHGAAFALARTRHPAGEFRPKLFQRDSFGKHVMGATVNGADIVGVI